MHPNIQFWLGLTLWTHNDCCRGLKEKSCFNELSDTCPTPIKFGTCTYENLWNIAQPGSSSPRSISCWMKLSRERCRNYLKCLEYGYSTAKPSTNKIWYPKPDQCTIGHSEIFLWLSTKKSGTSLQNGRWDLIIAVPHCQSCLGIWN